jgi:hypothetical protein
VDVSFTLPTKLGSMENAPYMFILVRGQEAEVQKVGLWLDVGPGS